MYNIHWLYFNNFIYLSDNKDSLVLVLGLVLVGKLTGSTGRDFPKKKSRIMFPRFSISREKEKHYCILSRMRAHGRRLQSILIIPCILHNGRSLRSLYFIREHSNREPPAGIARCVSPIAELHIAGLKLRVNFSKMSSTHHPKIRP